MCYQAVGLVYAALGERLGFAGPRRARAAAFCALAALGALAGCAGATGGRRIVERVGGEVRVRSFASATAYEAYLRAELAAQRGELDAAVRQLELARLADPGDPVLLARHAALLARGGDPAAAASLAREGAERFAGSAAVWLALGAALRAQRPEGGTPSAEETGAYARALAAAPDDPEVRAEVARAQGASGAAVAAAREGAPGAQPGDRVLAARERLRALGDGAAEGPALRSVRRQRAEQAWARGDYLAVDRWLSPLVRDDPGAVGPRVRLVEARVRDGRPRAAATLVRGLLVPAERAALEASTGGEASARGALSLAERARLWLLVERPELAREEAERALAAQPDDVLARYVLGAALCREAASAGAVARGLELLAGVPDEAALFADARLEAARALDIAGRAALAEALLQRAIARAGGGPAARDRLRLALGELLLRRQRTSDARAALAAVEGPRGRQERGALLSRLDPAAAVEDLRARTGEAYDDARADAWRALLCGTHAGLCAEGEGVTALRAAREGAPAAPETLRARALASEDRREAVELLRRAAARDPLSPWNGALSSALGAAEPRPGARAP